MRYCPWMRQVLRVALLACFSLSVSLVGIGQSRGARVQQAVDDAMARVQGAAVVLDVATGRLLAKHRLDVASRKLVRPGSTAKPFTLAAMIDADIVRSQTSVVCRRGLRLAGHTLDCSHVVVPEPMDGTMALAYSCNYFFVHMAESLSADALARTFREAGFASTTGLAPDEAVGVVQRPASRESLQLMAVGEDAVQVTPLGLAAVYQKLALRVRRGDIRMKPVVEGLTAAVRFGTGQLARIEGWEVAGKTGTSPSADRTRTHAWFAGFAPAGRPEIAVVVFLEQGSGGSDAAPIARRIFAAYK